MYLPEDVKVIIDTLYEHGYEAYAVGGCVRDMMLGREPGDWDITTSAMPEETKELFARTFDTGIEHGTITVLLNGVGYEVTTYRIDGTYEDSRHPSEVAFTRNLREDLQRRDFTINAMAYNDQDGVVDVFEGMQDLERKTIRCVGDAQERFGEDALRILRAIRFSAQLGFEIEADTCSGIQKLASTLANISAERIQVELVKLLISANPHYIDCGYRLGVTEVILPEWNTLMRTTLDGQLSTEGELALRALRLTESNKMVRIATLLRGTSEEVTRKILRRMKFDNETIKVASKLVYFSNYLIETTECGVRHAMNRIGADLFPLHVAVKRGYLMAQKEVAQDVQVCEQAVDAESTENATSRLGGSIAQLEQIEQLYHQVIEKNQCTTLKQLAVSGNDLLTCGVKQGKEIGEVLHALLENVLDDPECNTKERLLQEVIYIREKQI